jgi:hypothetical protein
MQRNRARAAGGASSIYCKRFVDLAGALPARASRTRDLAAAIGGNFSGRVYE